MSLPGTNKPIKETSAVNKDAFKATLEQLIATLGGNANIENITHCMTRLRFKLIDESLINK